MSNSGESAVPEPYYVLYDGHCKFCTAQSRKLVKMARPGAVEALDFQQPGVLERFPGVTHDACMKAMHLVTPDGHVYKGFEAAVRAVATRPFVGWVAYLYYVPGIRQGCDLLYRYIAANRYRLWGKTTDACTDEACSLHLPSR